MVLSKKPDPLKNALDFERPIRALDIQLAELADKARKANEDPSENEEFAKLEKERDDLLDALEPELTLWQRIQISRHVERPVTGDYLELLFSDVVELHGDRLFGDDRAIFTGFATLGDRQVMVVGHRKGRTTAERIACNWGCAHPEGYRKALRCMQLAERMGLPIITFINTPGAYPGIAAEERGQASAIAWNILEMSRMKVPIVSVVIGEGGSGGALGIGVCDRLFVMENAYYSVISPEGCASILWKDGARAEEAAASLKLSSRFLAELGVADEILPEPRVGAHRDKNEAAQTLGTALRGALDVLSMLSVDELLEGRSHKYRRIGTVVEVEQGPKNADEDPSGPVSRA